MGRRERRILNADRHDPQNSEGRTLLDPVRIEQWEVQELGMGSMHLVGQVYGHPEFRDGSRLGNSSTIEKVDGLRVKTNSRWYVLGQMNSGYIKKLKKRKVKFDPANPLANLAEMVANL